MSYRFRVDQLMHKNAIALWMMNYQGNETFIAKPFELEWVKAPKDWQLPPPTLEIWSMQAFEMIRALMDALAENEWIHKKTKKDGEVEAMKDHLENLKKMSDRLISIIEKTV